MGTELDLESKIWRLTGFGAGSGFRINFSTPAIYSPIKHLKTKFAIGYYCSIK